MTPLVLLGLFTSFALLIIAVTLTTNLFAFPRLQPASGGDDGPLVSVLVPARNEASVVGATVRALLAQTYPNFELLVLDDNSTDDTAAVVAAAGVDARLRLLRGRPLPPGWLGKNWACHQLAREARGEYLLFTDADVFWQPGALAALVQLSRAQSADLLTVWPTQQTQTWTERLVVPLIALAILGYLPVLPVHRTPWPAFAAANGQCLLFRRPAYRQIGGHRTVRDRIVEDVALARRLKSRRLRLRMADGAGLITCRMYASWPEVRDGFAKNILAGHGNSVPFLIASTIFHWSLFIFPWLWLLAGGGRWPLLLVAGGVGVRALSARATGQRMRHALLMPVSVILMTVIAGKSLWWHWRGRVRWKGRVASI